MSEDFQGDGAIQRKGLLGSNYEMTYGGVLSFMRRTFTKDLSGADLDAVNLFGGSLRKSNLKGTLLRHANLYGVDFDGAQPTIASLEGSNIDRTILQFRPPVI